MSVRVRPSAPDVTLPSCVAVARGTLNPLAQVRILARQPFTNTCVVFAEGEIIRLLREGKHLNDILAGATDAIVSRIRGLMEAVGIKEALCISGGVAKNIGVIRRLEEQPGVKACIADEPQIVGALGAALFAADELKAG